MRPLVHSAALSFEGNPYLFVKNASLRNVDAFGLSPQDVQNILMGAKDCTRRMTETGQRYDGPGWINNVLSDCRRLFNHWGGNGPKPFLGCGEQADVLGSCLDKMVADDNWRFEILFVLIPIPHQFVVAHSDNPSDPVLYLDPWNNQFSTKPPVIFAVLDGCSAGGTIPHPR